MAQNLEEEDGPYRQQHAEDTRRGQPPGPLGVGVQVDNLKPEL